IGRMDAFALIAQGGQLEKFSALPKRYFSSALRAVQLGEHIRNEMSRWETLLRLTGPYSEILSLEATTLSCLPHTMRTLRKTFTAGTRAAWLEKPELAVAAHRLSAFIRQDLVQNPDDIHDIANGIRDVHKTKQSLVEEVIRR